MRSRASRPFTLGYEVANNERRSLQGASGSIATPTQYSFVYRPGGVTAGNVFATWAALVAAVNLIQGEVLVECDGRLNAQQCPVPAGVSGFTNGQRVTLRGSCPNTGGSGFLEFLTIADGAVLPGVRAFESLAILNASNSPVITSSPSDTGDISFDNCSYIGSGTGAFFSFTDGGAIINLVTTRIASGTFLSTSGTAAVEVLLNSGTEIDANVFIQAGGSVLSPVIYSSGVSYNSTQTGALLLQVTPTAANVNYPDTYVPTLNATTVQDALNSLKAGQTLVKLWSKPAADAAAATATPETSLFQAFTAETYDAVFAVFDVGYNPAGGNTATITIDKRDGAGGAPALFASLVINGAGAAWINTSFTMASGTLPAGAILTVAITKGGAGVQLPTFTLYGRRTALNS